MPPSMNLRRVMQLEPTSCGIACVATVGRLTHGRVLGAARGIFGWDKTQRTYYTNFEQLKKLLSSFGIAVGRRINKSDWAAVPDLAIAAINHRRTRNDVEYWHWVVFQRINDDFFVLDPRSKREVRRDFGKMRLHAYLPLKT